MLTLLLYLRWVFSIRRDSRIPWEVIVQGKLDSCENFCVAILDVVLTLKLVVFFIINGLASGGATRYLAAGRAELEIR